MQQGRSNNGKRDKKKADISSDSSIHSMSLGFFGAVPVHTNGVDPRREDRHGIIRYLKRMQDVHWQHRGISESLSPSNVMSSVAEHLASVASM